MTLNEPLFTVEIQNSKLPRVNTYRQLDEEIKNAFFDNGIQIDQDTPIVSKKEKSQWRIASESIGNVRAYRLELTYDNKSDMEICSIYKDSLSGFPSAIWDFQIFSAGMVSSKTQKPIYYHGKNRKHLNEKQRQKWDYFFRPNFSLVESKYNNLTQNYERELEHARSKSSASKQKVMTLLGLFGAVVISLVMSLWLIAFFLFLAMLIYGFWFVIRVAGDKVAVNQGNLKKEISVLENYLAGFDEELVSLKSQLKQISIPSADQILEWMKEESEELQKIARSKYIFDAKEKTEEKKLSSFAIYQKDFGEMRKRFHNSIDSFYAFNYIEGKLVYSGQYFVFLFLTDDKICISRLFYDFILGKKYKEENKEYHFSNLVGIAINSIIVNDPFDDTAETSEEVSAIWMSFVDSNTVEIAIIDDDKSSDIVRRVESKQGSSKTFTLESLDEEDNENYDSMETTTVSNAMAIVHWIKDKKQSKTN